MNDNETGPDYRKYPNHPLHDVPVEVLEAAREVMHEAARWHDVEDDMAQPLADSVVAGALPAIRRWLDGGPGVATERDHVVCDLYNHENNMAVLRLPPRRFPGILVQGDTLWIFCDQVREIRSALRVGGLAEAGDTAANLSADLESMLDQYVTALDRAGVPLPFARPKDVRD